MSHRLARSPRARAVALLIGVLVVVWVLAPEAIRGSVSDVGTFSRVAALVAVIVAWPILIGRLMRGGGAGWLARYGPSVALGAWALWPYVRPATSVDEAFPTPGVSAVQALAPPADDAAPAGSPSTTVGADAASDVTVAGSPSAPVTSRDAITTTTVAEPTLLAAGEFSGLTGHRGDGVVRLYDLGDGTSLLRFESVDIGPGPKLEVYLVPGQRRVSLDGAVHVAALTAERGNQNYTVPAGVDLDGDWTVLVWCETFAVEVAHATLTI